MELSFERRFNMKARTIVNDIYEVGIRAHDLGRRFPQVSEIS